MIFFDHQSVFDKTSETTNGIILTIPCKIKSSNREKKRVMPNHDSVHQEYWNSSRIGTKKIVYIFRSIDNFHIFHPHI